MQWIIEVYDFSGRLLDRIITIETQVGSEVKDIMSKPYYIPHENTYQKVNKIILMQTGN